MTKTLTVIAATGVEVPMYADPKHYITDAEAVTVEDNAYYRRCIKSGDLVYPPALPEPEVLTAATDSKAKKKGATDGE
ncbi:DUF2635 domain-containing protein [Limnobaculum zhutongyuii]|uniref:DUF2635 domain-containing protein n=1 Tax=Limnobaculum zhutongyuii TaxID=2498113 RepID=A0A411WGU2_9GAMM|nr:DUF2635 domain-containing protein [Limnobaculum zhutongyuii]QBH95465.1 DUF2635 domain-containing protein [Limnobaculum zhutongyuii]TQS88846.1 DUF2635 domain-containing protein [Limnobaculum zhutongyuii]